MADDGLNSFMTGPDEAGRFGLFGGRFVSETLMPLILELEERYNFAKTDPTFWAGLRNISYLLEIDADTGGCGFGTTFWMGLTVRRKA